MLILNKDEYSILIDNDREYAANSADNVHTYNAEYSLGDALYRPSCQHSIVVRKNDDILRSCILLADGGATGIHESSAIIHGNSCLIAVGQFMCSIEIPCLELEWKAEVDSATCFGVYYSATHDCFISHGELEITRVEMDGKVLWHGGGKDIFTNGFELHENYVEVVDWNDEIYRIDIATGQSRIVAI